jgi:hypothetical protein
MAGITTNPEFRTGAARLHAACAERGLHLRHGAAETFLAQRIRAVADVMRISDRHALRTYIDETAIDRLVDVIADGAHRLHAAIDAASPLLLPVSQAARITAALGQVACWAATNSANDAQHATALIETAAAASDRMGHGHRTRRHRAGCPHQHRHRRTHPTRPGNLRRQTRHRHLARPATTRRGRPRPARRDHQRPAVAGVNDPAQGYRAAGGAARIAMCRSAQRRILAGASIHKGAKK